MRLIKADIYAFIEKNPHCTFTQLRDSISNFNGNYGLFITDTNVLLWNSMSEKATRVMRELIQDELISFSSTTKMTYLIDGAALDYPLAKSIKTVYKTIHWLPVTFEVVK